MHALSYSHSGPGGGLWGVSHSSIHSPRDIIAMKAKYNVPSLERAELRGGWPGGVCVQVPGRQFFCLFVFLSPGVAFEKAALGLLSTAMTQ